MQIKKQSIPKSFPELWYRSSYSRHLERETGQNKVRNKVRNVSKDQAQVKKVLLLVLGTDEGKTTLNLRLETFERKKSVGWYPCCSSILQCALMPLSQSPNFINLSPIPYS